ncbi:unconventional myosin-XVIIIb [Aix galericulata]|nr:unconventional myosin-XVIIIb [Aix galericulata]
MLPPQVLVLRLRDSIIKMGEELEKAAESEAREKESTKYYQRRMEEMKADMNELVQRELESSRRRVELEQQLAEVAAARQGLQADLGTAIRRIADLQLALEELRTSDESDAESVQTARDTLCSRRETGTGRKPISSALRANVGDGVTVQSITAGARLPEPYVPCRCHPQCSTTLLLTTPWACRGEGCVSGAEWAEQLLIAERTAPPRFLPFAVPLLAGKSVLLGGELPCRSASPCPAHAQSPSLQSKSCSVPTWKELVPRLVLCLGLGVCSAPAVPGGFSFPEEHWCNMTYGNVKRVHPEVAETPGDLSMDQPGASGGAGSSLLRSSSLRSMAWEPAETGEPARSPVLRRASKFGSCDSLLLSLGRSGRGLSSAAAGMEPLGAPRLRPWRSCLEPSVEEGGEASVWASLSCRSAWSSPGLGEGQGDDPSGWKMPTLSFERRTGPDLDEFLPAIRKSRSTSSLAKPSRDRRDGHRPLTVRFEDEAMAGGSASSRSRSTVQPGLAPGGDAGTLSDSDSSSGSVRSSRSADSIKRRPFRPDGEGCSGKGTAESKVESLRAEAEGKEDDVSSIMRKYLGKE